MVRDFPQVFHRKLLIFVMQYFAQEIDIKEHPLNILILLIMYFISCTCMITKRDGMGGIYCLLLVQIHELFMYIDSKAIVCVENK